MAAEPMWPIAAATGIGSLPGSDPLEVSAWTADALPDLPHLPELPGRGVGADAVGRSASLLVDLPVEVAAGAWQVASRSGADLLRARSLFAEDVNAFAVALHGWTGPLKVQVLGPITLAAALGQVRAEVAVSDRGLRRDLASSLAEGVRHHLADIAARIPGADIVLQIDEPSLPAVLAGALPTRSGWGRLSAVEPGEAEALIGEVLRASAPASHRLVHSCAAEVPVRLLVSAGADAISFDLDLVRDRHLDDYAAAVDAGATLAVGAVPTTRPTSSAEAAARVRRFWTRLGFGGQTMRSRTLVTPACGLAGVTVDRATAAYRTAGEAAKRITEDDVVGPSR